MTISRHHLGLLLMTLTLGLSVNACAQSSQPAQDVRPAPAFTHTANEDWINSKPLSWADLAGNVVLVDFWAFDCWNCYRSIPWLHTLEQQYQSKGLRIISVHTPELSQERIKGNLQKKVLEFGLTNPVMVDNDYSYWNALGNQYWPAFYLVDKKGNIRARFVGETHAGDRNALAVESAITALMAEH